jgi:bifunctional non-homologous end joining protein LigD
MPRSGRDGRGGGSSPKVRLSSGERVIFPDDGLTKGDLFAYYDAVADVLVPHLRDRPFTMKRYREGIAGQAFFQKQAPKGMPSWIPTRQFPTRTREGRSRLVDFPLVNSRDALLWMVQMHCIDMNAWYSRVDKPDRPDFVLFDLDPPDGGFSLGVRAAQLVREELDGLGLRSYVKTSGMDGIHVLVPLTRRSTWAQTHAFAEAVSKRLEERNPGVVTTEWLKAKREGVFVDYHQNVRGKTIASVYSVRPREGAPVSTPLRWEELTEKLDPRSFTMDEVLRRVEREGDLFEPVLQGGQSLGQALRSLQ